MHQLKDQEGKVARDLFFPLSSSSADRTLGLQSSGSSVQLPLGQSEASMAEHWPVQLVPRPQVTLVSLVSRPQQPTSIDSLENVNAESKKSTSVVVVLPLERKFTGNRRNYQDIDHVLQSSAIIGIFLGFNFHHGGNVE